MQIHISPTDGVPIYLQIVNQVKLLVASGRMASGDELPPIRTLAEKLTINPNTVARAYRELEVAGVVTKRRTAGTYVADAGSPLAADQHGPQQTGGGACQHQGVVDPDVEERIGAATAKPDPDVRGEGGEQAEGKEAADKDSPSLAPAKFSYHFPTIGIWGGNLD